MIRRVAHVALLVRDYDEALQFYRDRLGFEVVEDTALEHKRWIRLAAPGGAGSEILLSRAVGGEQLAQVGRQACGRVLFFLHTDDLAAELERLRALGVSVTEAPRIESYGNVAVFEDLYGNRIDLIEPTRSGADHAARDLVTHRGKCHCGRVRFEVEAPAHLVVDACNCSICAMCGYLHLIVSCDRFRLLTSESELSTYTFNTGVAKHRFCATCGIKPFYVPRSHPDGISVNARCLEASTIASRTVVDFDGANWEQNVAGLRERTPDR